MQAEIVVDINVIDKIPGAPDASLSGIANWMSVNYLTIFLVTVLATLILTAVILFVKRRKISTTILTLLIVPALALACVVTQTVNAISALTVSSSHLEIDIVKGEGSNPITKSVTSTTTVTTDNATGYTLSAELASTLTDGITAKLNNEPLSTTPANFYDDNTSASPSINNHTLYVTVPADIPVGHYQFVILYTVTENAPNLNYLYQVAQKNSITTMAGLTSALCQSADYDDTNNGANDNNTVTLTDTRNSQDYQVRKLVDGNCWMINNLKLGSETAPMNLTTSDTNITRPWTLPQIDNTIPANDYNAPRIYVYSPQSSDLDDPTFYGYHYNWCAATAGDPNTCTTSYTMPTDATQDICPAGWRMPRGGEVGDANNEWDQLNARMAGFTDNQNATYQSNYLTYHDNFQFDGPFRGVLAGSRGGVSFGSTPTVLGYWWSATHNPDPAYTYYLLLTRVSVDPSIYAIRNAGFSVRCLVQ